MKKYTCTVLATAFIALYFISCASTPVNQDDSVPSSMVKSVAGEAGEAGEADVPEGSDEPEVSDVAEQEPTAEILSIEPDEYELDYSYPEPAFIAVPEEIDERTPLEPSVNTDDTTAVDVLEPLAASSLESMDPSDDTPPTVRVPHNPDKHGTGSPVPVVPNPSEPTTANIPTQEQRIEVPVPEVVQEPDVTEPQAEIWVDETRASEPPPPVMRPIVTPSRSVSVPRDGILEVWYPGTGWVYLGDASGLLGVAYETRKIEDRNTLFSFRARRTGRYILEFSRYDVLTDEFIEDALAVTVTEPVAGEKTTVRAPDFTLGPEPEEEEIAELPEEVAYASPYIQDEPVLSGPLSVEDAEETEQEEQTPDELLEQVQSLLAAGDAPEALELLDLFFARALLRLDEGWYLRGQAYEANSPARNIRKALEAYETVVSAYPESSHWEDSDKRVRYIKQFYFRVR